MIIFAQTKIFIDQKCPNKAGGMKEFQKYLSVP
jgi:hypothetical protein